MKLVLLDIDGVLAIGPDGEDCRPSQEIHRASLETLIPVPAADTRIVLLTHRQRGEAEQIVVALGLQAVVHGLVCADDLLWQWFRLLLRGRVTRGLAKDLCAPILRERFGWSGPEATASIDDRLFNLERLRAAGVAQHCIHVPRPRVGGKGVRLVSAGRAVRVAYGLLDSVVVSGVRGDPASPHHPIVAMEPEADDCAMADLATGVMLRRVSATPTARIRAALAAVRQWADAWPRRGPNAVRSRGERPTSPRR